MIVLGELAVVERFAVGSLALLLFFIAAHSSWAQEKEEKKPSGSASPKSTAGSKPPTSSPATSEAATSSTPKTPTKAGSPQEAGTKKENTVEEDPEVAKQRQIVERFMTVLERNPRRGTAFDKIYGFHIENGTVESLAQQFRDRASKKEDDYAAWMILGLVESQRGRDAAAVDAFAKAKAAKKEDPIAPYYHGQALVLVGRGDEAVASLEEAIARKPVQMDLFEIIQTLGRVHQRAQRSEQALAVWNLFEKSFPGDARVQEQIAVTLAEEGQFAQALPRYEALVKSAKDEYRRSTFQIEAAELKVKLKRSSEGIADLEGLLDKLNPDSWLFREVRRKIESVFLRSEDQEGLTKYYLTWVGKHPEDVDAMARLSRLLAKQARVPEAREWLDKALKIAPSRKELRLAFIQQLVEDHRYADAIEQYKLLDQSDPNNPDYLREWGRLVMRDGSRPVEEKKKEAAAIWKKLLTSRASDPLATVQVADLLRNAGLPDEALPLYEKAVSLAPAAPQYREFLGEYLHLLKRPDEALATWKKIAEGKQRTPENLSRLAEVLSQFGYGREASVEIQAAAELDARDFSLQLRAADYQARAEQLDGALASLSRAEGLAQNDEEHEAVLAQRIRILQQMGKLIDVSEELRVELEKDGTSPEKWFRLARYQEALRLLPEATKSIAKSLELAPNNIPSLSAAARIDEQSGAMASAVERFRKLAVVDRRSKTDYLTQVARLEVQMGRPDEALAAGRDLIAASPGNIEVYQFYADLCFRLNQREEGLAVLRRSVRANPTDPAALLPLAAALAADFRTDEAIEIYWQAFEKSSALDDKINVITKLTELYIQQGQFDRLVERLDRGRKEEDTRREMTICLAQAHQTAGDIGLARQELQTLLTDDSRDTTLLQQVSKLAEADRDLPAAIRFQELLVKAAPAPETEMRLAQLYSAQGESREASAIFVKLAQREEDPERLLKIVDGLLATDKNEEVLAILEPKLRENSKNWELLYREGIALFPTRKAEASTRFRAILALATPDEEVGAIEKARLARAARMGGGQVPPIGAAAANTQRLNPIYRTSYIYEIRQGIGLEADQTSGSMTRTIWAPSVYFQARAAAIGWLSRIASGPTEQEALQKELRDKSDAANSSPRDNWDWIYYTTVILQTGDQDRDATRKLAKQGDLAGHYAYLSDIQSRPENQQVYRNNRAASTPKADGKPMPADELNQAVESLNALVKASDDPATSLSSNLSYYAAVVSLELKRAKRDEEAKKLISDITSRNKTPQQLATSITILANQGETAAALHAFDQFAALDIAQNDNRSTVATSMRQSAAMGLCQIMGATNTKIESVRDIFDRYISYHIKRNELRRQDRGASRATTPSRSSYTVYLKGQQKNAQVTFPPAGQYWDQPALNILRNAYEIYNAADLTTDFTAEIEKRRIDAQGSAQLYWELARAYVEFWSGEKESAAAYFSKATQLAKQDIQLQFDLANLHTQAQNPEEALAVLDRIQPSDQKLVIQKETAILSFAQQLGDLDRATIAAKRLFGMRIDTNAQMQLADSMRRLGMNEEAESILKRAERQTASRGAALVALMTQYLVEGKNDLAAEAAYRILRSTRATGASARTGQTQDDVNRQSALRCLQQTGKLKDQITLLEAQLERSPQSEPIYNALGEYYTAAGDTKKSEGLQAKLLSLRPDDADLRYRIGMTYSQIGKGKEACDLLLDALKKKPSLFGNQYYEVINVFRNNRRMADLGKLFSEMDLRQLGRYYVLQEVISYLSQDAATSELATTVLMRAVEAYPEYGAGQFIQNLQPDQIRKPEIAAMFRKSLIPTPDKAKRQPWNQNNSNGYSDDGTLYSTEMTLFDASSPTELSELKSEVAKTLVAVPQWEEGHSLLVMLAVRAGDRVEAQKHAEILAGFNIEANYSAMYGVWKAAQDLRKIPELRDEAVKLYEIADKAWRQQRNGSGGPAAALASMLIEGGDKETARKMLLDSLKEQEESYPGNPGYAEYQRTSRLYQAANRFEQLGFTTDALKTYRELVNYGKLHDAAIRQWQTDNYYTLSAESMLQQLVRKLTDQSDRSWVKELLQDQDAKNNTSPIDLFLVNSSGSASSAAARRIIYDEYGNAIRPTTGSPRLSSLLINVLKEKFADPALEKEIADRLTDLAAKFPADLPVAIAESVYALSKLPPDAQKTALTRLEKLVDAAPLEEIPAGKRANARQRAAAAPQMAIWLVARECLERPEWIPLGNKLADRALSAAQRQIGDATTQGLTFELAAAAAKRGDLPAAEAAYRRLIETAVSPKYVNRSNLPGPLSPEVKAPLRRAPVTNSQFLLAVSIAESAANLGLKDVSLHAIREAFSAGLPVADPVNNGDPFSSAAVSRAAMLRASAVGGAVGGSPEIERGLQQILGVWSRAKLPPAEVSQIIEGVMLPANRPREILIFSSAANPNTGLQADTGLLGALADWSTRADRIKEIEAQVAQRKGTVDSAIAGEALLLYIALAKEDAPKISAGIKALGERVKTPTTASAQVVLSAALSKVFERPELRDEASPVLASLMQTSFTTPQRINSSAAPPLLSDLVLHGLKQGKLPEAKALVDAYLKSRVAYYSRFSSPDSYNEFQYQDFAWAASMLARAGDLPTTLEAMAKVADAPAPRRFFNSSSITIAIWNLDRQLKKLPAAERYALLRDWTLPTPQRRSIRTLSAPKITQPIPTEIAQPFGHDYQAQDSYKLICSLQSLIEAAQESGRLEELAGLTKSLTEEKLPGSTTLALLVASAKGDQAGAQHALEQIDVRIKENLEKIKAAESNPRGNSSISTLSDYSEIAALLAAIQIEKGNGQALAVLEKLAANSNYLAQFGIDTELLSDAVRRHGVLKDVPAEAWTGSPLKYWSVLGATRTARGVPRLYALDNGLVTLHPNMARGAQFRYPITGDWNFTFKSGRASMSYGGLWADFADQGRQTGLEDPNTSLRRLTAGHVAEQSPARHFVESAGGENTHYEIRSKSGKIEFLVNGQSLPETILKDDALTLAKPWLIISSRSGAPTIIREPRLTGSPQILAEVDLIAGDRSDGWQNRTGAIQRTFSDKATRRAAALTQSEAVPPPNAGLIADAWTFDNGEITGPLSQAALKNETAGIYYDRELDNHERVSYEFFYEPGKSLVHPAIGNLNLLLRPEGVHLAWSSSLPIRSSRSGIAELVSAEELVGHTVKASGAAPLALKSGDWNQAELSLNGDELTLKINGQTALVRKLEPTITREFALFHYPRESDFRVRNIQLSGDWPKSLAAEDLANLLAWDGAPPSRDQARVMLAMAPIAIRTEANKLLRDVSSFAPDKRYEVLKNYVLPTDVYPSFVDRFSLGEAVYGDSFLQSPWLALVAAAKEAGKLPELKSALMEMSKSAGPDALAADGLLSIIASVSEDDATVAEKLKTLSDSVQKASLGARPAAHRSAWLASYVALRSPATREAATALFKSLYELRKKPEFAVADYLPDERAALGLLRAVTSATPILTASKLSSTAPQWLVYDLNRASDASSNPLSSLWTSENGAMELLVTSRHTTTMLVTPLTGDFTVTCKTRRTEIGAAMLPTYGGIGVVITGEGGNNWLRYSPSGSSQTIIPLEAPDLKPEWHEYKLEVTADIVVISLNGKRIVRERIATASDPWLRIPMVLGGAIKDFAITGSPTVPREIAITKGATLHGWEADFFGEQNYTTANANALQRARMYGEPAQPATGWRVEKDEIQAIGAADNKNCLAESLLRYQRPLTTGEEISLEFFYEPGKFELSPALGRTAYLIKPEGLKTHHITSQPYSSDGPAIDNETPVEGAKPLTLKTNQWNTLKLQIEAGEVKLTLNGEEIGSAPRDTTNLNLFGLFRRKNEVGAKIKNVTLKGAWPTALQAAPPTAASK